MVVGEEAGTSSASLAGVVAVVHHHVLLPRRRQRALAVGPQRPCHPRAVPRRDFARVAEGGGCAAVARR